MALTTHPGVWKSLAAIFAGLTALVALALYFRELFITVALGHVLIVLLQRVATEHRRRSIARGLPAWKRRLYVTLTAGFWAAAVVLLLGQSTAELGNALERLAAEQPTISTAYAARIEPYIPRLVIQTVLPEDVVRRLEQYILQLLGQFMQDLATVLGMAVLVVPLQAGLYVRRREAILRTVLDALPAGLRRSVRRVVGDVARDVNDYFSARIVESVVVGSLCCLGFYIAGLRGWLVFGVLAGVLNIVPFIGPVLSAVPPVLVTLLLDEPLVAGYVVVAIVVAQLVDQYYLEPFMIARRVRLDPVLGVLLPLAGAKLFGLVGMVFAVPIYSVYKIVLGEAYEELVHVYGSEPRSVVPRD